MDKPLPSSREAEVALIACIFLNNDIIVETIGKIKTNDFYFGPHQIIYSKLIELYKKNIPIDLITYTNSIDKELLKSIGGITYLSEIVSSEHNTINFKAYIKIIKDLGAKREIIKGCREAIQNAFKEGIDAKEVINQLDGRLPNTIDFEGNKTVNTSELMEQTINLIEKGYKSGGKVTGITTGYNSIDKATNGFMRGDLFIIAGRPSMGKTALALNMLGELPKENKALMFEMEMSQDRLGVRILASKSSINSQKLTRGEVNVNDFESITKIAGEMVARNNIFINCKTGLSIGEIKAEAKKIKLQHGLDLIFVDHIGKIEPDNLKANRNDQLGQITGGLKNIAKDLNICVIALSQLNREVEKRVDKRPVLSDLRDSGNIEQDADSILLLYREGYYSIIENKSCDNMEVMQILVNKNRDGETGLIKLNYNTKYQIITEE